MLGLAFEHQLRTLTAKPEIAAIFLMVNGLILFAAERFRRRAEVRELAIREGAKPDGGRELDTLEYREAFVIGAAQSTALVAGISRDGVTMGAGLARGLDHSDSARFAFLLATPIILAAGLVKLPDLLGHLGNGIRGQALVGVRGGGRHGGLHGQLPGPLLQDQDADPVRDLLRGVRRGDGHLHARLSGRRRRARHARRRGRAGFCTIIDRRCPFPSTPPKMFETRSQAWQEVGLLRQISPRVVKRARLEALVLLPLFVAVVRPLRQPRQPPRHARPRSGAGTSRRCSNRRWKRR